MLLFVCCWLLGVACLAADCCMLYVGCWLVGLYLCPFYYLLLIVCHLVLFIVGWLFAILVVRCLLFAVYICRLLLVVGY